MVGTRGEELDTAGGNNLPGAGAVYVFEYGIASSLQNIIDNSTLKIFPNPVQNQLFIESETMIEEVMIYNSIGQPVRQISNSNTQFQIDVSELSNGFYIIEIRQSNGQSMTKQFIKQ